MIPIAIFWILTSLILYCYFGYALVLFVTSTLRKIFAHRKKQPSFEQLPPVTLLVTAYNEENIVRQKVENSLTLTYPKDKIQHIWITDGSTDSTNALLSDIGYIKVLFQPERNGKTAALNRAIPYIKTPFVIFCDANTMLPPNAITEIITPFANPKVGCVAGEKRVVGLKLNGASSTDEGYYWKYESLIKKLESQTGSVLSAAGELFAIRTSLFSPIPNDTILDDFSITLNIATKGYSVVYNNQAMATEYGSANFTEEMKRKVRIAAGGFQLVARNKYLLNPFKYPELSFKFISHKLLRWAVVPICLLLLPLVNASILIAHHHPFYLTTMALILAFILIALVGLIARNKDLKPHLIYLPFYTLMANIAQIKGLYRYVANKQNVRWEKAKRQC